MTRTRAEKRQSLEVVNRRKNVRKKSAGRHWRGMIGDTMGTQSYDELKQHADWKITTTSMEAVSV